MTPVSVAITGVGAVTPIGEGAWRVAAAARAGLCGFREHPCLIDGNGEPVRTARLPWLDASVPMAERCLRMLLPAIDEAVGRTPLPGRVALALGLAPARPGRGAGLEARVRHAVGRHFGPRLTPIMTFESGHAAGLLALDAAMNGLRSGSIDACVVAGVDSYITDETLEWIEACDQLHGGGPLNNAWGFVPGEAAAAVLLEQAMRATRAPLARIAGCATAREACRIKTDTVCIGAGLTEAFRGALLPLPPGHRIDEVYCDMNGEAYRADEYAFTCLRNKERLREAGDFHAAADCWGDVGAAGAPLHMLQAIAACRKGYARGPLSMVWASSEGGERGAAVLAAPVARRE